MVKTDKNSFPRCPKCKSRRLIIVEVFSVSTVYCFPEFIGDDGSPPDYQRTRGVCKACNHNWTFKKEIDMEDLRKLYKTCVEGEEN